ncbi:hypothetical protein EE612_023160 [Oryza sativa]|nr:hypothetical protein EE612_023160 [Oryza sativa]
MASLSSFPARRGGGGTIGCWLMCH